jgi:hypothetical protein
VPAFGVDPPAIFSLSSSFTPLANTWYDVSVEGFVLVLAGNNPGGDDKLQFFINFGGTTLASAGFQLNPGQQSSGTETVGPLTVGDAPQFSWFGRFFTGATPSGSVQLSVILYPGGPPSGTYSVTANSLSILQIS